MDEDETQSAEAMRARDKAWLDRYRGGDINALGELVEHYRRPLFGYILRMTENSSDAEEIFQEVWFKAIRSFESYSDQKFLSWMFRITHNHIIDRARKKKPDFSLDDDRSGDGDGSMQDRIAGSGIDPERVVEGLELGERIKRAVAKLPLEQREVFIMRTEGQLAFKEIAEIQGTSINTALGRMQYALGRLREELKTDYEDFNDRKAL